MKATLKLMIAKVMTAGLLAGALMVAAPKKAEAAQVNIGVQFGRPVVYPDYYARRAYYDHLRAEEARRAEIARHDAWVRHEEWVRVHRAEPYPYPYRYYGR
jgi:hypothetical protein